jgi:hypothetical protein
MHQQPADDADGFEPGFAAELASAIALGPVLAGIGAFNATTVALLWSALS